MIYRFSFISLQVNSKELSGKEEKIIMKNLVSENN